MERRQRSSKGLCHRCQHPALTIDRDGVPFCARHSVVRLDQTAFASTMLTSITSLDSARTTQ